MILLVGLLVAACTTTGGPAGTPSDGPIAHPTGADQLVLRIATAGGFVAPTMILDRLPEFSLYGDGRVVTPGAQIAIYPAPAMPSVQTVRLDEAAVQRLLARAAAAGLLGPDRQLPWPGVADAPTTVFTVVAGGSRHVVSAYALGIDGPGQSETPERAALASFRAALLDLPGLLGTQPPVAVLPVDRLQVVAMPAAALDVPTAGGPTVGPSAAVDGSSVPLPIQGQRLTWPLAAPLQTFGAPVAVMQDARCGVLQGPDLAVALPAIRTSNQLTTWRSGGSDWRILVRPLLPDETGCAIPAA